MGEVGMRQFLARNKIKIILSAAITMIDLLWWEYVYRNQGTFFGGGEGSTRFYVWIIFHLHLAIPKLIFPIEYNRVSGEIIVFLWDFLCIYLVLWFFQKVFISRMIE